MDWKTLYCPNPVCPFYGVRFGESRLVKNGTTRGQHQALCRACGSSIALTYGTPYFELEHDPALFELAIRALAEGNSIRATARIIQVDKDTVCIWLDRAAQQCRLVILYLWQQLPLRECQLDELWSFVHTKDEHLAWAKTYHDTYGDAWVWVAFAPEWRLVVAFVVGKRTQAEANLLLERVAHVTTDLIPFFTSDQLPEYRTALLHVYGEWYQPPRRGTRGPHPQPRRVPHKELRYAQVVKTRERGRVVAVDHHVVFGDVQGIATLLASLPTSATINTSFVERENLALRQHNRRLTRKTNAFSKQLPWLEKQLWLSVAYTHLVLPHDSLRQEWPMAEPTRGTGSPRRWQPRTPAMAAGLTDHVWTTDELLSYRVPAPFVDQLDQLEHLFPQPELICQGN
jgi:IS1 family transposase/transposase-like protein